LVHWVREKCNWNYKFWGSIIWKGNTEILEERGQRKYNGKDKYRRSTIGSASTGKVYCSWKEKYRGSISARKSTGEVYLEGKVHGKYIWKDEYRKSIPGRTNTQEVKLKGRIQEK
jgi:hypothetical protein